MSVKNLSCHVIVIDSGTTSETSTFKSCPSERNFDLTGIVITESQKAANGTDLFEH